MRWAVLIPGTCTPFTMNSLYLSVFRLCLNPVPSLGVPATRQALDKCSGRPLRWWGWSAGPARRGCGSCACAAWSRDSFRRTYQQPPVPAERSSRRQRQALQSGARWEGNDDGHKLKHKCFTVDVRRQFFPHEDSEAEAQVVHSGAVSILRSFQLLTGWSPEQPRLTSELSLPWAGGWSRDLLSSLSACVNLIPSFVSFWLTLYQKYCSGLSKLTLENMYRLLQIVTYVEDFLT